MSLYEALYPYFYKLQFWHLMAGGGLIFFLANWQLEKKKWERENQDLIAYEKAMKEIEENEKKKKREEKP